MQSKQRGMGTRNLSNLSQICWDNFFWLTLSCGKLCILRESAIYILRDARFPRKLNGLIIAANLAAIPSNHRSILRDGRNHRSFLRPNNVHPDRHTQHSTSPQRFRSFLCFMKTILLRDLSRHWAPSKEPHYPPHPTTFCARIHAPYPSDLLLGQAGGHGGSFASRYTEDLTSFVDFLALSTVCRSVLRPPREAVDVLSYWDLHRTLCTVL
jgi:hypothetical protein